jgi:tetrahydromethanopterin S-methyltransferase subunit G
LTGGKMETVTALISGVVTLIVCMINNHYQQDKTRTLVEYRLSQLEKKVDKHNNLIERTYKLEEEMTLHEEKIKVANHRIDDLERKGE